MVYIIKFNIHTTTYVEYIVKGNLINKFFQSLFLHFKLQNHVMANQKSNGVAARLVALAMLGVEIVTRIHIVLEI